MTSWEKISSEVAYENPYYKIHKDRVIRPDGKEGTFDVVVRNDCSFIIAMDEDQKMLLVRIHRYPTDTSSYNVPAGVIETGEDPLEAAQREFLEETGYTATDWRKLGTFPTASAISSQIAHVFLATGLSNTGKHQQLEEGIDATIAVNLQETLELIRTEELTDSQSITSILIAALHLGIL